MSKHTQANNHREVRLFSSRTITLNPAILSGSQALQTISLLSPLSEAPNISQSQRYTTLLTINTYACTPVLQHAAELRCGKENCEQGNDSPHLDDQDALYDMEGPDTSKLPPVPTYSESQAAYYPHGVKRLPHFHPQKFSKRLRNLMDQRRRPQPLLLNVEPQLNSHFSPSPTPVHTSTTPTSLVQSILRVLPNVYNRVNQDEEVSEFYDDETGTFWSYIDHRVIIIGMVGLVFLAFALGAWVMAMMST